MIKELSKQEFCCAFDRNTFIGPDHCIQHNPDLIPRTSYRNQAAETALPSLIFFFQRIES